MLDTASVLAEDQTRQTVGDQRPGGVRVVAEALPAWEPDAEALQTIEAERRSLERDYRVAVAAALKTLGWTAVQIAEKLQLHPTTVKKYLAYAREHHGLQDVLRDIEFRAIPQAIENLLDGLAAGDKEYTLETLKGRGVFRNHSNTKTEGGPAGPLQLQVNFINAPPPGTTPGPVPGSGMIHAAPRE